MKIKYTAHAQKKFEFFKKLGLIFRKSDIKTALKNPNYSSVDEKRGVSIVLKEIDEKHNLRVVYKENNDIITVITFYATSKGRYQNENT